MYLIEVLRNIVEPNAEIKYDVYMRSYLLPKLWQRIFVEGEERTKAQNAFSELIKEAITKNRAIIDVIADGLENNSFPEFIHNNFDKWMVCLKYLAYGNIEIDRQFPQEEIDKAQEKALETLRLELTESFQGGITNKIKKF